MADNEQGYGVSGAVVAVLLLVGMIGFATQLDHSKDKAWTFMSDQVKSWKGEAKSDDKKDDKKKD